MRRSADADIKGVRKLTNREMLETLDTDEYAKVVVERVVACQNRCEERLTSSGGFVSIFELANFVNDTFAAWLDEEARENSAEDESALDDLLK